MTIEDAAIEILILKKRVRALNTNEEVTARIDALEQKFEAYCTRVETKVPGVWEKLWNFVLGIFR